MGVDTKIWGKPAWVFIHAAADNLDTLNHKQTSQIFWNSLYHVLPCCICRESASIYIKNLLTFSCYTNGQLAYILHDMVNEKLKLQELARFEGNIVIQDRIIKKWKNYHVQDNKPVSTESVLISLLNFCYYIVCDYDTLREKHIRIFFEVIGTMFGDSFGTQWKKISQKLGKIHGNLEERVYFVYFLHSKLAKSFNINKPVSHTRTYEFLNTTTQ